MSRFRFSIDSNLNDIAVASAMVSEVCLREGMDADGAAAVELCVVEALTNVVKHAYQGVTGNEVSLHISVTPGRLDFTLSDRGIGMPDEHVRKLSTNSGVFEFNPDDLTELPEGGMGLEIIRQGMDETAYSSAAGGNCFRLTKFLPPVTEQETL